MADHVRGCPNAQTITPRRCCGAVLVDIEESETAGYFRQQCLRVKDCR